MIRIGIIGCGMHGSEAHGAPLARFAKNHPGRVELTAACDVDLNRAKEFAEKFGFAKTYGDMNQMLSSERLDICHCIVSPPLTPTIAGELLNRKIPCVVEKPLACDRPALAKLVEAAHRSGTPHLVSVNRRFMPHLNRARKWAAEQGPVEYLRAAMLRSGRRDACFGFSTGLHAVDAIRHLVGDVVSFKESIQTGGSLVRDWQQIDFKFKSGALGRLDIAPSTGREEETYELLGDGFYARVVSYMRGGTSVSCYKKNELVVQETSAGEPQDVFRGEYAEVEEFVTAMEKGRKPAPSIDDIVPSMEICFAIAEKNNLPTCKN